MPICKICGKKAESEYCFKHKPRKKLKQSYKPAQKQVDLYPFFMTLWKKRPHVSEISGEKLFSPPSSVYFHHILPKSKYPEAAFDEDNIIFLTFDEHTIVELNPSKYPEINRRKEILMDKYSLKKGMDDMR